MQQWTDTATYLYSGKTGSKPTSLVLSRHGMARPVAVEQPNKCIVPSLLLLWDLLP